MYYIIILDAQGFRTDSEYNLEYSQKIFALCCLISSVVIYNYKKDDGSEEIKKISNEVFEHSYDLFNKLIPFLEKIKLEDNDELSEDVNKITPSHIPEFIWVYRDYAVNDFNTYNTLSMKCELCHQKDAETAIQLEKDGEEQEQEDMFHRKIFFVLPSLYLMMMIPRLPVFLSPCLPVSLSSRRPCRS